MNNERSRYWSLTINNPNENDEKEINLARQKGWRVEGQKEQGEQEQTPHYQLSLDCLKQQRFSAIKKAFARAHIEKARNWDALQNYVVKEETRVGSLPQQQTQYPSQQEVWSHWTTFIHTKSKETMSYLLGYRRADDKGQWLLYEWDEYISQAITEGYYVELIGINPQIRACVSRYGRAILLRHGLDIITGNYSSKTDKTDKTEDNASLAPEENLDNIHNPDGADEEELSQ